MNTNMNDEIRLSTTLIVKDRVLGHNPVAALYTADGFYSKKL